MISMLRFNDKHLPAFGNNWRQFLFIGIALLLLGSFAIIASVFTTLLTVVLLGCLLLATGIVLTLDAIFFWWGKKHGFIIHLLFALLYLYLGYSFIVNPVEGSMSLTFLLGVVYLVVGIFRIVFYASSKLPRWGWGFTNGIATLVLGAFILLSWPSSSLFILGLFIGIEFLFVGWAYLMTGLAARGLVVL